MGKYTNKQRIARLNKGYKRARLGLIKGQSKLIRKGFRIALKGEQLKGISRFL